MTEEESIKTENFLSKLKKGAVDLGSKIKSGTKSLYNALQP